MIYLSVQGYFLFKAHSLYVMRHRGRLSKASTRVCCRLFNASLEAVSLDLTRAEALGGVLQALSTQVRLAIIWCGKPVASKSGWPRV
jgi:hypothetical protein